MKAIQIEAFGNPAEVVKAVDVADIGAPAAGEVLIARKASPINRYDLLMIAGGYGYRPRLPAIMGTEGVGRVVAVGEGGVKQRRLRKMQRARPRNRPRHDDVASYVSHSFANHLL